MINNLQKAQAALDKLKYDNDLIDNPRLDDLINEASLQIDAAIGEFDRFATKSQVTLQLISAYIQTGGYNESLILQRINNLISLLDKLIEGE